MRNVLMAAATLLACVAMGGSNCGGGANGGCAADIDCADGQWCRNSDGSCQVLGDCITAADCGEQNLTHIQCAGAWMCGSSSCEWACSMTALPGMGETCGDGDACQSGLQCIHYYGIAGPGGPEFRSCEKRCSANTDCSGSQSCVTISDGPGRVCRARNG